MPRTLVSPPHRVPWRVRANHVLAAGLAAAIAAGAAAISYSGHPRAPAEPNTAQAEAITFGDAPVTKGARGRKTNVVTLPVFGDPTVRKGAGGR
jgi:hypothetical protein